MKRLLLFVTLIITVSVVYSQKSIDALFERYAGREGFVSLTINGNLLNFLRCIDDDDADDALPSNVTEIRMLVQEDDDLKVENFYDQAIKGIDLDQYDEFMRVKESDQDVRMLVKAEGRKFKEFLLIAGGEDNVLIQIKGDMTFNEAERFSNDAKKNHGISIVANSR